MCNAHEFELLALGIKIREGPLTETFGIDEESLNNVGRFIVGVD